jgi:predicted MFS family arabinose efflux permease
VLITLASAACAAAPDIAVLIIARAVQGLARRHCCRPRSR